MITDIENKEEEKKDTREWRSCCLIVDKQAVKYITQTIILSSLIVFSSIMLVIDKDCNSQRNYSSLLMFCLGCYLPSPKLDK